MGEIIFAKSQKNLKKVYNRLTSHSVSRFINREEVLFLAMGGYNRTFEMLLAMGLEREDIATFSNLTLSTNFLMETHLKKMVYIKKINYVTSVAKGTSYSKKSLDLNLADGFEESMMIYKDAARTLKIGRNETAWIKPSVVVLDDQSLNLQYDGHRFYYQSEIGFVQIRNRNADPRKILKEIEDVEEADRMMFALYQNTGADEAEILDALNRLRVAVDREVDGKWYMKPTEFKRIAGSDKLATTLKEMDELQIEQLSSNRRIGKENARWVIIPNEAFNFKGFDYKDEADKFDEALKAEEQAEEQYAAEQERRLNEIMMEEFSVNMTLGYVGNALHNTGAETLQSFLQDVDSVESETVGGIDLLSGATTAEEYQHIKKHHLAYFLDGDYKDNVRNNNNYLGGKRLVAIDVDDGDYTREQLESKLESQDLFGVIYPTARYYFDGSNRWRVILMADDEMDKETYSSVVEGVSKMLHLEIDEASKKVAQLMGYPLAYSDVSIVIGSMVSVEQFKSKKPVFLPNTHSKVVSFGNSEKSLVDFNHHQARLLKEALETGIPEGRRNNDYRQIVMFLRDTQADDQYAQWHEEAKQYELEIRTRMLQDGLSESEMELICR